MARVKRSKASTGVRIFRPEAATSSPVRSVHIYRTAQGRIGGQNRSLAGNAMDRVADDPPILTPNVLEVASMDASMDVAMDAAMDVGGSNVESTGIDDANLDDKITRVSN